MTDNDSDQFAQVMTMLDEAFGLQSSALKVQAYFEGLRDFEIGSVKHGAVLALRQCKFYPRVAEIRELVEGAPADRALAAWETVDRAILEPGTYQTVIFQDPIIHFAVDALGGWPAMGQRDNKEWGFVQRDFVRLYELGVKRELTWADVPGALGGIHAATNTFHGHHEALPAPVSIPCLYLTDHARQQIEATRPKAVGPGTEETAGNGKEE